MAEDRRADRTGDKAHCIDRESLQRAISGLDWGRTVAENQAGHGAVKEEIIPLDRGPDRAGDDGATELRAVRRLWESGVDKASVTAMGKSSFPGFCLLLGAPQR